MAIRIMLNPVKAGNYGFWDPEAPIGLNLSNPSGYSARITISILRALRSGKLIDVDGVVDLKTGKLKSELTPENAEAEMPSVEPETVPAAVEEAVAEDEKAEDAVVEEKIEEPIVEEPVKEKKKTTRTRKTAKVVEEDDKIE